MPQPTKSRPGIIQPEEYKIIPLTKGQFALVDNEDFSRINIYDRQAAWSAKTQNYYAHRSGRPDADGKRRTIGMHREVMRLDPDDPRVVDHQNLNPLDNRRSTNLRIATQSQNAMNRTLSKANSTGYKGVTFDKDAQKFRSHIRYKGGQKNLGYFDDALSAHLAYRKAAEEHYGEFARFE